MAHILLTVAPIRGVEIEPRGGGGTVAVEPRMSGYNPWRKRMNGLVAWSFRKCEIWAKRILSCTSYGHRKTSRTSTMTSAPLTSTGNLGGLNWNQRQAWMDGLNGLTESLKRHYVNGTATSCGAFIVLPIKNSWQSASPTQRACLGRDRSRLNSACCAPISKSWIESL